MSVVVHLSVTVSPAVHVFVPFAVKSFPPSAASDSFTGASSHILIGVSVDWK